MQQSSTPKSLLKHSLFYDIFALYVSLIIRLFYRKIVIEGKENIPKSGPLIFSPNHQNALMDPLLVLYSSGLQIVFLARADIFSKKIFTKFLQRLKMLPVYRIRDGKSNLSKNDDSFDTIVDILEHKLSVGIFPEAAHNNKRRLLSLKKGIPRVAFLAEENNQFNLGVKIVPVGIYYSKYNTSRSIVHIRYGKPINVSDYKDTYLDNDKKGMLALKDAMLEKLKPLVIDIRNLELYDIYESIRALYVKQAIKKFQLGKLTHINKFRADKITISSLDKFSEKNPEAMSELSNKVKDYNYLKNSYRLSDKSIEKPKINLFRLLMSSLLLLVLSPIFIYGLLNNLLAYFPPKLLVKGIKDVQFHSSVKFVWGLLVIPILYLIQFFIVLSIFSSWVWAILYLLSLPISGFLAKVYFEWATLIVTDYRKLILKNNKTDEYLKLIRLHQEIAKTLDGIVLKYK